MTFRVRISLPSFLVCITVAIGVWAAAASLARPGPDIRPPAFSADDYTRTVYENASAGTPVVRP